MKTMSAEKLTFFKWVNSFTERNINIGPVNETLIKLFEDVEKTSLTAKTKKEILEKNS
jgi:hypothetical protein